MSGIRVLVVDDEPQIHRFLRPALTACGYEVQMAETGRDALCTLATPEPIKHWSMTTLKEKLIKIGAKVVSHGRYVTFQMAEVGIPRNSFADFLRRIAELRPPP